MDGHAFLPRIPRATRWLPLGLTWLALAVRVAGLTTQSLWRDEVDTLMFATRPLTEALQMFRQPGQNGPLYFLALRPWLAWAGSSEFALRFPAALAGALAVPIGYGLVARLAGRKPAALTALLLAIAPYLVWYGQEAKMYAALTVLIPASLWLTVDALQRGRWWRWALLYLVTTLAIYTHLLAALIVPVQLLWLLLAPPIVGQIKFGDSRSGIEASAGLSGSWTQPAKASTPEDYLSIYSTRPAARWRAVGGYLAALVLPYLPLAIWQADMLLTTYETGHRFVPLGDILLVLAAVFSLGVLPGQKFLALLPAMLALTAGIVLWPLQARRRGAQSARAALRRVALLLSWLVLPALLIYGISLRVPTFTERYLIWMMPAFLALVALGVIALARAWRPLGLLALGLLIVLNLSGVSAQTRQPIKADLRAAAQYVGQRLQPGDRLIYQIPYIRYTFTYYSSGRGDPNDTTLPWLDGPYTNHGMSEAEVDAWMSAGLEGAPVAWLIASEAPMWDERGLTEAWLAAHGRVDAQAEFTRVKVTRYELQGP